jgi:MerR family transcriptional regulator, copper efflux regulator
MLIGELARRSGVPAKTLRFYEDAGVLPAPARTQGGYRDYGEDVLGLLAFARAAQSAGLSLAEIRGVIAVRDGGVPPCSHVTALLDAKADEVAAKIAELRGLQRELSRLRAAAADVDAATCDPSRVCEVLLPAAATA